MAKLFRWIKWVIGFLAVFALISNIWVVYSTADQIIPREDLDNNYRTALVLGTSYNTVDGEKNSFFYERMNTASSLYHLSNVRSFILSGSATNYYNEPQAMIRSLVELGVPDSILIVDSLGVRTLSSIIRCKEVYHTPNVIIVTQRFHAYRALFLSNFYDLPAVVVTTEPQDLTGKYGVLMREFFARPLAVIDLYILNRQP